MLDTKKILLFCLSIAIVLTACSSQGGAVTVSSDEITLTEEYYTTLPEGYILYIISADPYYSEVEIALISGDTVVSDYVYEEGEVFSYNDNNIAISFDIIDVYSGSYTDYVTIKNTYVYTGASTGSIVIYGLSESADIYLDGYYQTTTGSEYDMIWLNYLEPGYHSLEISKRGYDTISEAVYVYSGEPTYYTNYLQVSDSSLDPGRTYNGSTSDDEALAQLIGVVVVVIVAAILLRVLRRRKNKKHNGGKAPAKPSAPITPPPVVPKEETSGKVIAKTAFSYKGSIVDYKVKVENQTSEPIGDIRIRLFVPDVFLLMEKEKVIAMLEPGEGSTVTFQIRPTGECGECKVSGNIEYYDYGTKKRKDAEVGSRFVNIICPVLKSKEVTENEWREYVRDMISTGEDSKDLEIPAENLFSIVSRVLKDMNLYMIEPEITSTPQLYTAVGRFFAEGVAGMHYAAYIEVVGKRRSRLILKVWAEKESSLTGFYHKMLEEIEKRIDIKLFVDEGLTQYNINNTTIQDSLIQRSNIGNKKKHCPACGSEIRDDQKFCTECGEQLD